MQDLELLGPHRGRRRRLDIYHFRDHEEWRDRVRKRCISRMVAKVIDFFLPSLVALLEFKKREQAVVATFGELQAQASAVMDVISNPEVVSALRQDKLHNLAYLKDNHAVCHL